MKMARTDNECILVAVNGHVATVRLNRPAARNALNHVMRAELGAAFDALSRDREVRVIVLTGNGSAFCAGVDLKEPEDCPAGPGPMLSGELKPVTAPLDTCAKPIVAAVNGPAFGGGFELALAADLRVCSTAARFCLPEVSIGSLPGSGGTQRLARAVPNAIAAKMLFLGEPLGADEAQRYGLVSDVFAPDELVRSAEELAGRVAANAPLSLLAVKQALAVALPVHGLSLERSLWAALAVSDDRAEGRRAFRDGRPPEFKGR